MPLLRLPPYLRWWLAHGRVVGDEMRALNNIRWIGAGSDEENGGGSDLSGHGPDVNQPRDPRNGRNGELLTEDPFLGGQAAEQYIRGMPVRRGVWQWGEGRVRGQVRWDARRSECRDGS